ncbi:MAG TPA: MFS transporter [Streptosporangiaceae bacterium]|nr:MFS transporter [Streptosporangiaceae bacterium]
MTEAARRATFRDVFAIGEFRSLWLAYLLSIAGDQLALVALTVLVYSRTHSPLATAAAYTVGFLPWLIGGPALAGLADRIPRRTVMIGCDLASMVLVAVMAVPAVPLWALIVLLFAVTLFGSPYRAARSAMLPDILTGDRYVLGTAAMQTTNRSGRLIGFAAGGAVVGLIGARPAMGIDAATFIASALLLRAGVRARALPIGPERHPTAGRRPGGKDQPGGGLGHGRRRLGRSRGSGLRLVFGDPTLRALVLLGWLVPFYAVPEAMAVPYAAHFHGGAAVAGLILGAGPCGSLIGTILFGRLVDPPARLAWMGPLAVSCCAVLALCATGPPLGLALVIIAAAGVLSAYQLATNAAFVAAVPAHRRGQAFGVANGGINVGQGVWFALAGLAAETIGPARVIAVSGVAGAAVALALALTWQRRRRAATDQLGSASSA